MQNVTERAGGTSKPVGLLHLNPSETSEAPLPMWTRPQYLIHGKHRDVRMRVLEAFGWSQTKEHQARFRRVQGCASNPLVSFDRSGRPRVVLMTCKDRLCPHCQKARSTRVAAQIAAIACGMGAARFITLTLKHLPDERLADMLARLSRAFRRLRASPEWKRRVKGGVSTLEVKRGQDGGWHAHLHLIADGSYFPQAVLSAEWCEASEGSTICDVRAIHDRGKVAKYVAKYVSKQADIESWSRDDILEFADALHGKRMVTAWGSCFKAQTGESDGEEERERVSVTCSVERLRLASLAGSEHASRACDLLARCGPLYARLVGRSCVLGVGVPPPLDDGECKLLESLCRWVGGEVMSDPLRDEIASRTKRTRPRSEQAELWAVLPVRL